MTGPGVGTSRRWSAQGEDGQGELTPVQSLKTLEGQESGQT